MFEDKQPANPSVQVPFSQIFGRWSIVKNHVLPRRQRDKKLKLQLQGHKKSATKIHPNPSKSTEILLDSRPQLDASEGTDLVNEEVEKCVLIPREEEARG